MALATSVVFGVITQDLIIGGAILFTGILNGYFASIGKRSNYVMGVLNYAFMGWVALKAQIYGMAGFYALVCIPLQIYGFINWGKNLKGGEVKTRKFTRKLSLAVVAWCLMGSAIIGYLLSLIPGERLSFLDATSNCINLCAMILMARRYMESWWLWLVNNAVDLLIWTLVIVSGVGSTNAPMMLITCIMYLATNVYGIYCWRQNSRVEER